MASAQELNLVGKDTAQWQPGSYRDAEAANYAAAQVAKAGDVPLTFDQWKRQGTQVPMFGKRKSYEIYLEDFRRSQDADRAEQAENSAREFEKMMSDTAFSRYVEDIKRSGLNPRLALDNAGMASTPSAAGSFTASGSSSSSRSSSTTSSNSFSSSALFVALLAVLAKMLK